MKKTLCIMLTTVMLLSLTGCQGLVATRIAEAVSSDELANNRVKAFLEAVEKGDKGEIKGMLAPKTIKKVEDIDAQIDALIDFYKGETKKLMIVADARLSQLMIMAMCERLLKVHT